MPAAQKKASIFNFNISDEELKIRLIIREELKKKDSQIVQIVLGDSIVTTTHETEPMISLNSKEFCILIKMGFTPFQTGHKRYIVQEDGGLCSSPENAREVTRQINTSNQNNRPFFQKRALSEATRPQFSFENLICNN